MLFYLNRKGRDILPPKIQYTKEQIIDAAIEIVRREGLEAVNARSVAKKLGCSTQPVFREFENMAKLKEAILLRAFAMYERRINSSMAATSIKYKASGIAYIKFAEEEPALFRLLFMRDRNGKTDEADKTLDEIIKQIMLLMGISKEAAYEFHTQMWIYTHGIAVMAATNYIHFTEAQIDKYLREAFMAFKRRFQEENE